jgi:hypothetical protein
VRNPATANNFKWLGFILAVGINNRGSDRFLALAQDEMIKTAKIAASFN